tara:strand:+ start:261 stop:848 length:588 start_codon:yes stop_codon:yes gene_type:complete
MKKILIIAIVVLIANINFNNYAKEVKHVRDYLGQNPFNKEYVILVDYGKSSGMDRMFIYNLNNNKIEKSFKVAHGRGNSKIFNTQKSFSNVEKTNKSSLGMSVIKEKGYSNWGINVKYILQGLEKTNCNNKRRNIVLHSWSGIKEMTFYPLPLLQSQGCPTVSNSTMKYLDKFLTENKNVLLYTFNNKETTKNNE